MESLGIVTDHLRPWVERAAICAYELGVEPAILTQCDDCDVSHLADVVVSGVEVHSPEAVARATADVEGCVGLLSWDDALVVTTATAAALAGFPHTSVSGVQRARNKHSMRRRLDDAGLPGPRFGLVSDPAQCAVVVDAVGLPVIIKPINGTGSALVRRADSLAELEWHFREMQPLAAGTVSGLFTRAVPDPDGTSRVPAEAFLVEECLTGPEIDLELVVRDGRTEVCLMSEVTFAPDSFRESAFVHPPFSVAPHDVGALEDAAAEVVRCLEIDNCTANMTFMLTPDSGPVLVEVNAGRPGGHLLAAMAWHGRGVDIPSEATALALGQPAPSRGDSRLPAVAALSFYPREFGTIAEIRGLDELRQHPSVISALAMAGPGDVFAATRTIYPVLALVGGFTTRDELLALHDQLTAMVEIDVRA